MENFLFWSPTKYIFGADTESAVGPEATSFGMKNVLIVFGGGSAVRSGLLDRVKSSLGSAGIICHELGGIAPNPTDGPVREGIDICRRNKVDGIIAVGGGSVIDTAKAIAAGVAYDGDFWDFFIGKARPSEALPIGVVLTIPAAGSEGSGTTVITLDKDKRKISLRTDYILRPKFAILDPKLTFTLPPFQTASGIADMMAHIMERYFSPSSDVVTTDRLCEGLLKAIIEEAPKVIAKPDDYQARANIMWAGTLAHNGICGTGRIEDWSSHAIEHEISALYNVTHGAGLAVVFPAWMTFVAESAPAKLADFARNVFGVECEDDAMATKEGIARLRGFFKSIGLPVTFSELGVPDPDIYTLVARLHENKGQLIGGYVKLSPADSERIYRLCSH